jgi:hypothetical protein
VVKTIAAAAASPPLMSIIMFELMLLSIAMPVEEDSFSCLR